MIDKPWGPAEWRTNADKLEAIANDLEEAARILAKYQEPVHGLPTRILSLRNSARLDRKYADTLEPAVQDHTDGSRDEER